MIRGLKFRFYPTPEQEIALAKTFGSVRYVYNWALDMRTKGWYEQQERINYAETSAALTKIKKKPEFGWLNEVSSVGLQQSLRNLQAAFVNFWNKRSGYPKFKRKNSKQSVNLPPVALNFIPLAR